MYLNLFYFFFLEPSSSSLLLPLIFIHCLLIFGFILLALSSLMNSLIGSEFLAITVLGTVHRFWHEFFPCHYALSIVLMVSWNHIITFASISDSISLNYHFIICFYLLFYWGKNIIWWTLVIFWGFHCCSWNGQFVSIFYECLKRTQCVFLKFYVCSQSLSCV